MWRRLLADFRAACLIRRGHVCGEALADIASPLVTVLSLSPPESSFSNFRHNTITWRLNCSKMLTNVRFPFNHVLCGWTHSGSNCALRALATSQAASGFLDVD